MRNAYLHNNKLFNENRDKKKKDQTYKKEIKKVVDINILLNKVKVEENIKKKRKVIIFSFATLGVFLFGIFIVSIK